VGVRVFPRVVSYALGDVGTWLAARLLPSTGAAIAHNLRAVFPDEPAVILKKRARRTLQAYARDTVDFLRTLRASDADVSSLFELPSECIQRFRDVIAAGRGAILVTGHYGNWEVGGVVVRRVLRRPLTIVAMAEASAEVNRIRREIRVELGIDTIEVRQSLETALQIRRRLSENGIVAMLMDRHLGRDRVGVTFLGRPAWFLRTPALMSYLTGAPLMPCFIERKPHGGFAVFLSEPIVTSSALSRDEATRLAAQQFADQLTLRVREHPEYWYQFYRYWDAQSDLYEGLG
jgi:lauroyl/myristoyl acyltransferase